MPSCGKSDLHLVRVTGERSRAFAVLWLLPGHVAQTHSPRPWSEGCNWIHALVDDGFEGTWDAMIKHGTIDNLSLDILDGPKRMQKES